MGFRFKNFMYTEDDELPLYAHEPKEKTNNNDLSRIVYYLEKIYTTTDWPEAAPSLTKSLKASGKSRADLWAFAGNIVVGILKRHRLSSRKYYIIGSCKEHFLINDEIRRSKCFAIQIFRLGCPRIVH